MKLTIITINRNNSKGLCKTMDSVICQDFQDYEYVVIDGASEDDSVAIIQSKSSAVNRIIWISEPDSGVYNAMNKGIQRASGEYLFFLNSGDFLISNDALSEVFISNNPSADILCARCNVSENGRVVWTSNPPKNITLGTLYFEGLAHQSTFIRKSLFDEYGLYREDFKYNSDIEFWYRTIIWGNASTEQIPVITTDYNLEGMSSRDSATEQFQKEQAEILSNSFMKKILPDYDHFKIYKGIVEEYQWINNHKIIRKTLKYYHKFLKKIGL